jgi:IclR family transcriptional regulator, pca regulon regulatory protein
LNNEEQRLAPRRGETMGGLAKGLAIIEAFATKRAMSVADAARAAGATRAAARRCLLTLEALGYLERAGRDFRPLPRLRRLGGEVSLEQRLAHIAQPFLDRARDDLGESVSLAVLKDDRSYFIARAEAEHIVSTGVRVGAYLPSYCSATGRVLLSGLPQAAAAERLRAIEHPKRTPRTLTTRAAILAEIKAVAERGFAVSDEELEPGLRAVAVPVYGKDQQIVAALSVSASAARVKTADLRRIFFPRLRSAAQDLSAAMAGDAL